MKMLSYANAVLEAKSSEIALKNINSIANRGNKLPLSNSSHLVSRIKIGNGLHGVVHCLGWWNVCECVRICRYICVCRFFLSFLGLFS